MAVAYVNSTSVVPSAGSLVTSIPSIGVPSGTVDGNIMFLVLAGSTTGSVTTPSGWTAVSSIVLTNTAGKLWLYQRTAASEPGSYTIAVPSGRWIGSIVTYSGALATLDAGPTTSVSGTGTTPQTASVTTVAANAMVVRFMGLSGGHTATWPASTERQDLQNSSFISMTFADLAQVSPGASGTEVVTPSGSSDHGAITLSLGPLILVAGTRQLVWSIVNQIAGTRTLKYDMLNQIAGTRTLKYDMLNQIAATRQLVYGIQKQIAGTRQLVWGIQAQVSATRQLVYSMLNQIAAQRTLKWDLLNQVAAQRKLVYDLLNQVSDDRTLFWDILAAGRAASQRILVWDLDPRVQAQVELLWDLQNQVAGQRTLKWDILDNARNQVTLKWDLQNQIAGQRTLVWDYIRQVARQRRLRWHIGDGPHPADRGDDSNLRERDGIRDPRTPFVG